MLRTWFTLMQAPTSLMYWLKKPIKAVTLIEVMLALLVFGIGILTILRLLTENSWRIYDIRSKDTSILLAKEAIEIAYNARDSNKAKDMFWNCALVDTWASSNWCDDFFYMWWGYTYYLATRDMEGKYILSGISSTWIDTTMLYLHEQDILDASWNVLVTWASRYDHNPAGWTPTIYSRYLAFAPVSGYVNATWLILQVESHVTYKRWWRERKVILESLIGEIR